MIVSSVITAKTSKELKGFTEFFKDKILGIDDTSTSIGVIEPAFNNSRIIITGKIDQVNFHSKDEQTLINIVTQMRYKALSEVEFTYLLNEFLYWYHLSPDHRRMFKEFVNTKGQNNPIISDLIIGIAKFKNEAFPAKEKKAYLLDLLVNKSSHVRFGSIYGLSYLATREDLKKLKDIACREQNPIVKSLIKNQIQKLE